MLNRTTRHFYKAMVFILALWLVMLAMSQSVRAQIPLPSIQTEVVEEESRPELATPRDTVRSILVAIANPNENALAENFVTRPTNDLSRETIQQVIAQFPTIINSYGVIEPVVLVSDKMEGSDESNLTSEFERVGRIRFEGTEIPILLERVTVRSGEKQWLVSRQTVKTIAALNIKIKDNFVDRIFSDEFNQKTWRNAPLAHWFVVPFILSFAAILSWFLFRLGKRLAQLYAERSNSSRNSQVFSALVLPISMVFGVFVFYSLEVYLGLSILIRQDMSKLTITIIWLAFFIMLWLMLENFATRGEQILRDKNRVSGVSLVIFLRAIAKTILIIIAIIAILTNYGVDVTTGLAALGLGGIAIALGAQKAIENIVGSIIIIIDQPFRVGDFCKVGSLLGTVEHIGLRSTRIRTLSDTLVTYPNGELSSSDIENFTMRKRFLLRTTLNLRYETSSESLEKVLTELRQLLKSEKYVSKQDMRVRFIAYGAASKDVEIFTYIIANDFAQFLERQEKVLLNLSEIVERHSGFAFPSQTIYMAKDQAPPVETI